MHWEARFRSVSATHEGLVARFHLPEIGLDSRHWWRAIRSGRWLPAGDRVVRSAAAPATETQRVLAAVLDASPGAVLHATFGPGLARHDRLRPRRRSSWPDHGASPARTTPLARSIGLRDLRPHDVIVVDGVVTETALRAIWAEAARYAGPTRPEIGVKRIGSLLDQAHRLRAGVLGGLARVGRRPAPAGPSGDGDHARAGGTATAGLEPDRERARAPFRGGPPAGGSRGLRRQRAVGGHEPIGRCDFADEHLPLVVEVNSLRFHTTPTDRAADERRYQALIDAGFTVCVIWEPDLWTRTGAVVATLADARRRAAAGQRVVVHSPGCPWPPPLLGTPTCS